MPYSRTRGSWAKKGTRLASTMFRFNRDPKGSQFSRYQLREIRKAKSNTRVSRATRSFKDVPRSKRYLYDAPVTGASQAVGTLYQQDLTRSITQGDGINQRLRQLIYVKSVKLSLFVENINTEKILNYRWALLSMKGSHGPFLDVDPDFYLGTSSSRYVAHSSVGNGMHHMSYPLNRDKFTVFAEGKKTLAPKGLATNTGDISSFLYLNEYIPVGQRVDYDGTSVNTAKSPIYLVWWVSHPDRNNLIPLPDQMKHTFSVAVNFVDPC